MRYRSMRNMRRALTALALAITLTFAGAGCGCASNPAPKEIQVLQATDTVLSVLTTFSHAVENAADTGVITVPQAKGILAYIRAAAVTLKDVPSGGFAVASAALNQIEATVQPEVREKIMPYLVTARAALETFKEPLPPPLSSPSPSPPPQL